MTASVVQVLTDDRSALERAIAGLVNTQGTRIDRGIQASVGELTSPCHRLVNRSEPPVWDNVQVLSYLSLNATPEQLRGIDGQEAVTRMLSDRLLQGMAQVKRRGQRLALIYLDLDGFKTVNDSHGHDVGDQLLPSSADRLPLVLPHDLASLPNQTFGQPFPQFGGRASQIRSGLLVRI